jgi:heat-inducible transcriptional repressor
MAMLTPRRAAILRCVVEEYVDSAQPVASRTVARKHRLAVSPATIRNEMMRLEDEGYLCQPHTSAGRVPSDKGYRYYVEQLMQEVAPTGETQRMIRHQFHQVSQRLEDWTHLAAAVVAHHLHSVALVTAPRQPRSQLRWLEIVRLQETLVLLVVILQQARVRQRILSLSQGLDQERLSEMAHALCRRFAGMTAPMIRRRLAALGQVEQEVMEAVASLMEREDLAESEPAALEGIGDLARQPEFAERDRLLPLLDYLEGHRVGRLLPFPGPPRGSVRIIIGSEHPEATLHAFSLVVASYGGPEGPQGEVALLGPTRLRYGQAVGMVRYVASLLDELMSIFWG